MAGNKKFVVGLSDKYTEFIIYYINDGGLVYLRRYSDSDKAMTDLMRYSLIGTSDDIGEKILCQIEIYLRDDNIHDFIRSIFTIFKYDQTPEFQEVIQIIDSMPQTNNDLIYKSELSHLINCVYPDNNMLAKYVNMYYLAESIKLSLSHDTLYDPGDIVKVLINQIMVIFDYDPNELCQC